MSYSNHISCSVVIMDIKGVKISMPSGSKKSQDLVYKIAFGIFFIVIAYIIYQIYLGYTAGKEAVSSIVNIPEKMVSTIGKGMDEVQTILFNYDNPDYQRTGYTKEQIEILSQSVAGEKEILQAEAILDWAKALPTGTGELYVMTPEQLKAINALETEKKLEEPTFYESIKSYFHL